MFIPLIALEDNTIGKTVFLHTKASQALLLRIKRTFNKKTSRTYSKIIYTLFPAICILLYLNFFSYGINSPNIFFISSGSSNLISFLYALFIYDLGEKVESKTVSGIINLAPL